MGCYNAANEPQSPVDTLNFLLGCVEAHLVTRPEGVPGLILVGAEGVGRPYGCGCSPAPNTNGGVLLIEAIPPLIRNPEDAPGLVTGCEPCDLSLVGTYKVTVKRCVPPFDNSATDGSAIPAAVRNAAALGLVEESWLLIQAIRCCINAAGNCQCGNVTQSGTTLADGCGSFWTEVTWDHTPCCPAVS